MNKACFKIFVCLYLLFNTQTAFAEGEKEVQAFVDNIAQRVIKNIESKDDDNTTYDKLTKIFYEVVDVDWMGRFALGRYWHSLNTEQKDKYIESYRKYLRSTYVEKFTDYNGHKYNIDEVRDIGRNYYMLKMEVFPPDSNPFRVSYRIIKKGDDKYKIRDIVVENTSLLSTHRSEFSSYTSRNGIDALVAMLAKGREPQENSSG